MADNLRNPSCPNCGSTTVGYSSNDGVHWRCSRFPACDGAIRTAPKYTPKKHRRKPRK